SHVSLPEAVEVKVGEDDQRVVLAKKEMNSRTVFFPEAIGSDFFVKFYYIQPLRIREIDFGFSENDFRSMDHLRFLAQPKKDYLIYYNADRYVEIDAGERPNLFDNEGVMFVSELDLKPNVNFIESDIDKDEIIDEEDNCVIVHNPSQKDVDENGRGDACDDFDRDGIINSKDNCPNDPNKNQKDEDLDGKGDICDNIESRFLQKQKWLPGLAILIVLVAVGGLIIITVKRK
ncbi:MAG: thrombospondin type 3 repeat-containing protein, partial [Patescibacteria group bacterium]|nr:thrombospondin type 3 repeat-containing protein [Patescibacteria group bacterium]